MNKLSFRIIGAPIPKARPRFFRKGNFVSTYTPTATRKWEDFCRFQAIQHKPEELWGGALWIFLNFYLPRPKSLPKKVIHHIKKPDIENLSKSVLDALEGIIYKNDSQVVQLIVLKGYANKDYGVDVTITEE